MYVLNVEEVEQVTAVVANWWELWPVYVSALVSVAGAITAFFAPKAVERLRHKLATELQEKQQEDALEGIREQHDLSAKLASEEWQRAQRIVHYRQWQDNQFAIGLLFMRLTKQAVDTTHGSPIEDLDKLIHEQATTFTSLTLIASPEVVEVAKASMSAMFAARKVILTPKLQFELDMLNACEVHIIRYMAIDLGLESMYEDGKQQDMQRQIAAMLDEYLAEGTRLRESRSASTPEGSQP